MRAQGSPLTCSFVGGLRKDVTQALPEATGIIWRVGTCVELELEALQKEASEAYFFLG